MAVTINEIAKLANVSKSTVSRVINKSGPVSDKTKDAVLRAIASVNYQPSQIARSLALKKTNTIGLVVQDIRNPYFALACWHVERFFRQFGYITIMCNADNDPLVEMSILTAMTKHSVDGIILIGGEHESSSYGVRGIPVVMVDRGIDDPSLTSVTLDNEYGGQLATDYLFSLGHERIAFLTSDCYAAEQQRLQGYVTAHRNRGVTADADMIIHLEELQWHQGDLNRILRVFSLNKRPTAVFASNDFKALQVMRLFRRNNISVPDDISVIGFDDIDIASIVHPALTTVHQPIDRMVELGAQLLLDQLDGGVRTGVKRVMSPWLVERESVRRIA